MSRPRIAGRTVVVLAGIACLLPQPGRSARAAMPATSPGRCIEACYEGVLDLEGHYARPGDTRRYHSRQRFVTDAAGQTVRLDWTTWAEGDSAGAPESWLVERDGRVFKRSEPGARWREIGGEQAALERLQTLAGLPWMLQTVPGATLRWRGARIESCDDVRAHPRLGDVRNRVRYRYDGGTVPSELQMVLQERDHGWTLAAVRSAFRTDAEAESLLVAPVDFDPVPPGIGALTGTPVVTRLADGVWSIDCEDIDSRTLVVEFADYVAVVEAAVGSAHGERLVDVVQQRWPDKPIRWALFSHHHPHYTGGLRALVAAGATVVTTSGNEAFVRRVVRYPFRREPDRLARAPRPLRLQTFHGRFELADATNRLVAIDIGTRSTHTDEFVVFWLPQSKLVFETEQGWVTTNGELRASRRGAGFLQTLAEEGVDAERLVQSWPMRGNRAEVSRAELEELVRKRK